MQAVLAPAPAVKSDHFAFDAVQAGCQRLLHLFEDLLFAFVGAFPYPRVRVRAQVDQRWQR